jgi:23S rRNA pseudouridine1911/1915/1917 synthase
MRELRVSQVEAGQRADVFVADQYPEFSRSSLEGLFDDHKVTLKDRPIKESYKVRLGDELTVDDELIFRKPKPIKLPILYEDDDVLVLDKPAGILSHSKGALNTEATVASFIRPMIDKDISGNRAGIVHRLDRATSGVIITAKNQAALNWLQKQFSTRKTKKTYLAIVEGLPVPESALIDAPIRRNPKKPQTFQVHQQGKPAQTEYKLLKTTKKNGETYSLLELRPLTGRTHQLRVHLAYIKHPVVGDRLYGREGDGLMLHARQLELTLPSRERMVFESPIPDSFQDFAV